MPSRTGMPAKMAQSLDRSASTTAAPWALAVCCSVHGLALAVLLWHFLFPHHLIQCLQCETFGCYTLVAGLHSMPFQVTLTPRAEADLSYFRRFEQRAIVDAIRRLLMRTFDLRQQHITVEELLRLARTESVRIVAEEGDEFILEVAEAFEREIVGWQSAPCQPATACTLRGRAAGIPVGDAACPAPKRAGLPRAA